MAKTQLEAAATNYYATMNRAYATLDENLLDPLTTAACTCNQVQAGIKQAREGKYAIDLHYQLTGVTAHDVVRDRAGATLSYNLPKNVIKDSAGKVVQRFPPVIDGIKEVSFVRVDGHWLVSNIVTYK